MLTVVRRVEKPPAWWCLIPGCGATFTEDEHKAYLAHMVGCSRRHEERLRFQSMRVRAPGIFDPFVAGDPELLAWVRKNAPALIEGRLRQ